MEKQPNVLVPATSKIQDRAVPIPDYTSPQMKHKGNTSSGNTIQDVSREIPIYSDSVYLPPPKPVKTTIPKMCVSLSDIDPELNTDFGPKEYSSFQEGVISETYQRLGTTYFQEPQESNSQINTGRLVQKFLPKQADIDKILKIIQRKVPKGMHLPVTVREIQARYIISSSFKDLYLAQNKLLVIPEVCADKIITLYHSSLFTGYQDVIKTYLTIGDKVFIPSLIHYLHLYIKGCLICQLYCKERPPTRQ